MANTIHKSTAELRAVLSQRQNAASAKLAEKGKLTARARMDILFDEGTFVEVGAYVSRKTTELDTGADDSFEPVITGYGSVNGMLVFAFSQDFSRLSGALGEMHAKKICDILDKAMRAEAPVIGVFDSAGAKVLEGVDALAGYGKIMAKYAQAMYIPKIAVISGPCGGSAAVIAKMSDIVIAAEKTGSLYMVPSSALTDKTLGTPARLASDGMCDLTAPDDASAVALAGKIVGYFGKTIETGDDLNRTVDVASIIGTDGYDVHDIINVVADNGSFTELQATHSAQMVIGLCTIGGKVTGVVANNPAVKNGIVCPCAIEKATDLINMCSYFDVPVLTLVDSCGVAEKDCVEEKQIEKKLASLACAYADCDSAKVTVVLGKAYGTTYTVFGSKSVGADIALALDSAKISALNPVKAVEFFGEVTDESKVDLTADEWAAKYATPLEAAKGGHIDDIIESCELRQRIAASFEMLSM